MYDDAFESFPEIQTSRLKLRQLEIADVDDIYEYAKDQDAFTFTDGFPHEYDDVKFIIDVWRNETYNSRQFIRWAIELKTEEKVIGGVYFFAPYGSDVSGRRMDMGIDISRKYWNKGYASEAIQAISYYGLTAMGLKRVQAQVLPDNVGSLRAFEKAGFMNEGILRNFCPFQTNGNNIRSMAMLSRIPEDL